MHCPGVLILRVFRGDCDYIFFFKSSFLQEKKKNKTAKKQALNFIRVKKKQIPIEERTDEKEKFD